MYFDTGNESVAFLINTDIRIYEGNEGVINMVRNRFSCKRTKHVNIKHGGIARNAVKMGLVNIEHGRFEEQHADVIMKTLDVKMIEIHASFLTNSH